MATRIADLPLLSRMFDEALKLEPAQLDAWLDALPADQRHLQQALREMLAAQQDPGASDFLSSGPRLEGALLDDATPQPEDRIGPYRLIRELGRGGMGAVWLAERADGTLRREVALKLPRLAWGAHLARRMARERDIGARLAHPNIARLYDAGIDDQGRPYLALECIDGQPLNAWCSTHAPTLAQRLRLFVQIVRAVAYAHGRLVVHRDLKPSNVLVSADGQAHLLDFGIARLLQEEDADGDDEPLTQEQTRVLTPHYASPEQLGGEAVTVASDIYSLGVLLFEMLTGRRPHAPGKKGLAALEAAVLEGEPPLASRSTADARLAKALRGDIDAIIAKALKRNPGERYATADALADDIERHLAGAPVLAQPDRLGYRAAKLLRRHRLGFGAATAVLLAVLGGAGLAAVQARRANEAAARASVVKEFVVEVFKVGERGNPANAQLRQLPVELLVERGARLIESRFTGQALLQAELYGVVAGILADMGANELAATYAQRQLQAQARIGAGALEQAQASLLLAQALLAQGKLGEALPHAQHALAHADADSALHLKALVLLARVQLRQGLGEQASATLAQAEQEARHAPAGTEAALVRAERATLLVRANRFDEALPLFQSSIDQALAAEGPLSPTAIDVRLMLALNLMLQDRPAESRVQREAAMAALRAGGGAGEVRAALESSNFSRQLFFNRQLPFAEAKAAIEQARDVIVARGSLVPERIKATIALDLGNVLLVWGDLQHAAPLIDASVTTLLAQAESPRERYGLADVQAIAAMYAGRHDQADAMYQAEFEAAQQMGVSRHPDRAFDYARRAMNRSMQRRTDDALAILASAPDFEPLKGADTATVTTYREVIPRALARVHIDSGNAAAAWAALPPAANDDPDVPYPFDELLLRGEVLCALGRGREALPLLERSLKIHEGRNDAKDPALARARATTGLCALANGQRRRAMELAALARGALADQPEVSPYFRQASEQLNALLPAARR